MLRSIDASACANRWRHHSDAVGLLCAGMMAVACCSPALPGAPLTFATVLMIALLGPRIRPSLFARALLVPAGFVALGCLGLCWSIRVGNGWSFRYDPSGAQMAVRVALRACAASSVLLLFAFTIPVPQLMSMLRKLRVPESLIELVHLTYRALFALDRRRQTMVVAQRNRLGYCCPKHALRCVAQLAGALLIESVLASMRLERGLLARGYVGRLVVLPAPSHTRPWHLVVAVALPTVLGSLAFALATIGGGTWP